MAGYGYRSSSSPQTDEWRKTSYAASDHDVIGDDGEGRKRPIVSFTPTNHNSEYYVTRTTETVVQEQINLSPYASSEMKQPPPLWAPEGRHHGVVEDKWQKHPNACPPQVEEFVTRPKFGPMSASTWHQTAKPSGGYGSEFHDYNSSDKKQHTSNNNGYLYDGNNNYYSNYNKEPLSPVGTHASPPHYRHADPVLIDTYDIREATPVITHHGGWVRPTATTTTWASPPNSNLTKPTSDIPTVIGILKEVAKPFISTAVYAEPGGGGYTQTIDSKEAAARYANFGKFKSSPKTTYSTDNNYATTIDSREAARKYHGAAV